jgi:hypothetical protein
MLWNSPGTLLLARGAEIKRPGAIADRFKGYYEGTWHIEPDMSPFHITSISKDVMQFLVPVVFTRGLPGQPSQDSKFLVIQTLVHDANGILRLRPVHLTVATPNRLFHLYGRSIEVPTFEP